MKAIYPLALKVIYSLRIFKIFSFIKYTILNLNLSCHLAFLQFNICLFQIDFEAMEMY